MTRNLKTWWTGAALATSLALSAPGWAHSVWLAQEARGVWHVKFGGHGGEVLAYPAERLRDVRAFDRNGRPMPVTRRTEADGVRVLVAGRPGMITAHYDNGTHSRTPDGRSTPLPMNEVPGSVSGTRALKYGKTIVSWTPAAARATGQSFEVVPVAGARPVPGRPFAVRVLIEGQPAAGISIARNEEGSDAITDADGIASFVPARGFNKLWAGRRMPVTDSPGHTQESVEYILGFTLP